MAREIIGQIKGDPLKIGLEAYSPDQQDLLRELTRLQVLRGGLEIEKVELVDRKEWEFRKKIISWALYSTFLDCEASGIGDAASAVIAFLRETKIIPA